MRKRKVVQIKLDDIVIPDGTARAEDVDESEDAIQREFVRFTHTNKLDDLSIKAIFLDWRSVPLAMRFYLETRCKREGYTPVFKPCRQPGEYIFFGLIDPQGRTYTWPETGKMRQIQEAMLLPRPIFN